ncbi:hypothetical protein V7S43_002678 [Phytophthora oleae]|uniref:LYC1 C-terminal domain-containing protein n=1 Tax=Phytophthora oleae TaxID=2107226 RepID=A0ABD3FZ00_9STRA
MEKIASENSVDFVSLTLDEKLDEFLQADNTRLVEELSNDKFEGQEAFAVLPSRDSIEWQFCIGVHFARVRKYEELPSRCGVAVSKDAFLIWCHDLKERLSTLFVRGAQLQVKMLLRRRAYCWPRHWRKFAGLS